MINATDYTVCDYAAFLNRKNQFVGGDGFEPLWMPDFLFDFQRHLVEWSLRRGAAAIWAGCGLGKTPMALTWAYNVFRKTGKPVLIVTPLAVAGQFVREGEKFGIDVEHSRDGKFSGPIVTCNYERLHYFDPVDFGGAVLDEAQGIRQFDGKRRKQIVRFFSKFRYRLLDTATPLCNDYIELGTESECLGVMPQSDMLGFFFRETKDMRHTVFKEGDFWNQCKYIFKPHSEKPFWKWVVSWARGIEKPSDLGFDDTRFILPPIHYETHVVDVPWIPPGELFPRPAVTLIEQKEERLRTNRERCERVKELLAHDRPSIVWCHYNEEGDYLEKILPDCVQVAGRHSLDEKEDRLWRFLNGDSKTLVTKAKIAGLGLNMQHCGDVVTFPTFSFHDYHQSIRRCWRFGRKGPVNVHIVTAPGESRVMDRLTLKQDKAGHMFRELVCHMNEAVAMDSHDRHKLPAQVPAWMN
jgi:hypothetical protein